MIFFVFIEAILKNFVLIWVFCNPAKLLRLHVHENIQEVFAMLVVLVALPHETFYISRLLIYVTHTAPGIIRGVNASASSELYVIFSVAYFFQVFLLLVCLNLPQVLRFWDGIIYPKTFFTL